MVSHDSSITNPKATADPVFEAVWRKIAPEFRSAVVVELVAGFSPGERLRTFDKVATPLLEVKQNSSIPRELPQDGIAAQLAQGRSFQLVNVPRRQADDP